ncbi:hypothetical protein MTO96_001680 [Rhipicephalus appendiculatus]
MPSRWRDTSISSGGDGRDPRHCIRQCSKQQHVLSGHSGMNETEESGTRRHKETAEGTQLNQRRNNKAGRVKADHALSAEGNAGNCLKIMRQISPVNGSAKRHVRAIYAAVVFADLRGRE